jgi:fumarate reductase flavoprotein subunit
MAHNDWSGRSVDSNISTPADLSADVVVIGGGASGLPAAVRAAESGATKVVLLERRRMLGGMGRIPAGLFAVESPAQKRLGIQHTADELFRIHMTQSVWMCDARLVRTWLNGSAELVAWLEEKGMVFNVADEPLKLVHQIPDKPLKTGNTIVNTLVEECERLNVHVITETRAQRLLLDEEGNVNGVVATQKDGEITFRAKSVIIATGPISGNIDLMSRYYPNVDFEDVRVMTNLPQNSGDGLLMAESAGATKEALISSLWIGPGNHKMNMSATNVARRPHMIWVNSNGMRFADETLFTMHPHGFAWLAGFTQDLQPGRVSYALMDHKTLKDMIADGNNIYDMERLASELVDDEEAMASGVDRKTGPQLREKSPTAWLSKLEDAIEAEAQKGNVKIAGSLNEIAQWIGADAGVLQATIEQYNSFCEQGHDADFLKPKEWLLPLSAPPYYAFKGGQALDSAFGGIRVNHRMEVLNKELKPIGGLYAAGAGTSGWLGPGFTFGCGAMGFCVFSGYAAGRNAAENARSGG